MMKKQLLYKNLAKYYDLIYHFKDYKKETIELRKIISKYKKSEGKDLLEVACGTGEHIKFLKNQFNCVGLDMNSEMLKIAKRNNKNVGFFKKNMVNFKVNKKFDIITCLFSSIGYVRTYANLNKTLLNFSKHLNKGGLIVVEPWFDKKSFHPGSPFMYNYDGEDIKISRHSFSKTRGNLSIVEMQYLVVEKNKGISNFKEIHELGLFEKDKTLDYMKKSGLKAKFLKNGLMKSRGMKGRGIFIGVKD